MLKGRRGWRAAVLATLVVGICGAATVAPATAGNHFRDAGACDTSIFGALGSLDTAASTARGEDAREPVVDQVVAELPASARGKGGRSFRASVPVYFHVVHADGVGNIPQRVITDQMAVLNAAFAGFYGGSATGFQFRLMAVTRTNNAAWHYHQSPDDERAMKRALHRGGWNALNIYATTAGPYLGWAYLPGLPESQLYKDGIVVDWESMPGASSTYAGRYDLGHTATHEAGHWLDLWHTFDGGCNNWGDHVDDTPPQRVPTNGCPIGQDSCREPGLDPIHNYMDYSYDACYDQFTKGQAGRMQDAWLYFRA